MLPPENRVRRDKEFSRIFKRGRGVPGEGLFFKIEKTQGPPRFAVVVSKKVSKLATRRNRIRRIITAALAELLPSLWGMEAVILVAPGFKAESQKDALRLLAPLLQRGKKI